MTNKEFAKKLEKRTIDFAIMILNLCAKLPDTTEAKIVRYQLAKAGTSVGANYREANWGRSKADFKSRIGISESESSESAYWLEIISRMKWLEENEVIPALTEAKELLAIFTSIGNNTK
ncbi:MAG TPA: four helix bundle protein [Bacteroidales bacterium]|nr:four helix bundle protein [Bacteroidales bacterium]